MSKGLRLAIRELRDAGVEFIVKEGHRHHLVFVDGRHILTLAKGTHDEYNGKVTSAIRRIKEGRLP